MRHPGERKALFDRTGHAVKWGKCLGPFFSESAIGLIGFPPRFVEAWLHNGVQSGIDRLDVIDVDVDTKARRQLT
jgi:hypothetical protein